jgi:hypothetical protein
MRLGEFWRGGLGRSEACGREGSEGRRKGFTTEDTESTEKREGRSVAERPQRNRRVNGDFLSSL